MRRALAALILALLCSATSAGAQGRNIWQDSIEPGCASAGPTRLNLRAISSARIGETTMRAALTSADRVVRLCPDDPELRLLRARLLYDLDRFEAANRDLAHAISVAPDGPYAPEAAFMQGVTLTRLERFAEAVTAYELFLAESVWPRRRAIALTNLAETQMALGHLDRALTSFRLAVAADSGYTLAYFGLAVVLDRRDELAEALDAMLHGLSVGVGFQELSNPDVFYVPAWEIHYYRALAHEVLDERALALAEWHAFLNGGGDSGPYAARVRAHIRRLSAPTHR